MGRKSAGCEVDRVPYDQCGSDVEGERQPIGVDLVGRRIDGLQISADSQHILTPHFSKGRIGHRWIEVSAAAAATAPQRGYKLIVGPSADSGLTVRRNVRPDQGAEGCLQRDASSKRLASRFGVTRRAIG